MNKEARRAVVRKIAEKRGVSLPVAAHIFDCPPSKLQKKHIRTWKEKKEKDNEDE